MIFRPLIKEGKVIRMLLNIRKIMEKAIKYMFGR